MTINKRKMKKLLSIAFAAALTVGVASAQETKPAEGDYFIAKNVTESIVKSLTEKLALTKPQQDSIAKHVLISAKQETDILEAQGVAIKTKREQQQANLSARTAKIKTFLTKEQLELWAKKSKEEEEEN